MPTAVASFDDSFDFDEPARKKAPRKPRAAAPKGKGPARKKAKKRRLPSINMQKAARYGAIGMSGALCVAIMVNALVLQKGRHPAPLFGQAIALGPSPTPVAKAAPVQRAAVEPEAEQAAPAPQPMAAPTPRHAAVQPESGDDLIGALIDGKSPPPPAAAKAGGKTLIGAQRALAKLGYTLKPTGTMGPQTRKAIETYERDHHLAVNGELTPHLIKVLAADSHMKID